MDQNLIIVIGASVKVNVSHSTSVSPYIIFPKHLPSSRRVVGKFNIHDYHYNIDIENSVNMGNVSQFELCAVLAFSIIVL